MTPNNQDPILLLTLQAVDAIERSVDELGEGLEPALDSVRSAFEHEPDSPVKDLAEARLVAYGGLLARLQQSFIEASFWCQGLRSFLEKEQDREACARYSKVVMLAWGGMRNEPSDPGTGSLGLENLLGALGLAQADDLGMIVVRVHEETGPDLPPVA